MARSLRELPLLLPLFALATPIILILTLDNPSSITFPTLLFFRSLLLSLTVATLSTLIALPPAWLLVKSDLPFKRLLFALTFTLFVLPPYLLAQGWINTLETTSPLYDLLFGFWGVVWVQGAIYLPLALLILLFALRQIDRAQEESALLYTSPLSIFFHLILPRIRPYLLFSTLLIFALSLNELSIADTLRYRTFTHEIFERFSAFYDLKGALWLSRAILFLALLLLILTRRFFTDDLFSHSERSPLRYRLTTKRKIILSTIWLVFLGILLFYPLITLLKPLTIDALRKGFVYAFEALWHTVVLSVGWAFGVTILGLALAWLLLDRGQKAIWEGILGYYFLLPSTILAVLLIYLFNRPFLDAIYHSVALILIAWTIKYLILFLHLFLIKLRTLPPSQIEAAALAGAKPLTIFSAIILPLSRTLSQTLFLLGYILAFKESSLTMMLQTPSFPLLSTLFLTHSANARPESIATLACLMILLSILSVVLIFAKIRL